MLWVGLQTKGRCREPPKVSFKKDLFWVAHLILTTLVFLASLSNLGGWVGHKSIPGFVQGRTLNSQSLCFEGGELMRCLTKGNCFLDTVWIKVLFCVYLTPILDNLLCPKSRASLLSFLSKRSLNSTMIPHWVRGSLTFFHPSICPHMFSEFTEVWSLLSVDYCPPSCYH